MNLLLCIALSLAPLPLAAQDLDPKAATAENVSEFNLKDTIDVSIRWIRARQAGDGSYEEKVMTTSMVLLALAESPRKYRVSDGPFIRDAVEYLSSRQNEDTGKISDAGADPTKVFGQTIISWMALTKLGDPRSLAIAKKAEMSLSSPPVFPKQNDELEAAAKIVRRYLPLRREDGTWNGEDGPLIATAEAVSALSEAYRIVQANAPTKELNESSLLPSFDPADREKTVAAMRRGASFLVMVSDGEGRWGPPEEPDAGITSMALGALLALPEPRPTGIQAAINKGVAWLASLQDKDGSIHDGKLKNYITSAAVMTLVRAGREEDKPRIAKARDFLIALQADEGEGYSEGDLYYGGIGYGGDERPDLSNLQMALEALSAAGVEKGDPAYQRALKFLERTQNRSESNDTKIVRDGETIRAGDDGGAVYAPGDSKAGFVTLADGSKVPRSYGSMTYALLKGLILAGLPKEDPRMIAAWKWVSANYSLDVNPGFEASEDPSAGYQGLYYYFHTMARALDLYGADTLVDPDGTEHAWRTQLCGRLLSLQNKNDGSWLNELSPRWWEGNPLLATSYALLTLEAALPKSD
jgi:squalene-hopene/tetraprenyl-beta-curcumene cyclase